MNVLFANEIGSVECHRPNFLAKAVHLSEEFLRLGFAAATRISRTLCSRDLSALMARAFSLLDHAVLKIAHKDLSHLIYSMLS